MNETLRVYFSTSVFDLKPEIGSFLDFMLFNLFFADKIYVTIFKNKLKSPEFAKELRDAKNGSHIEALHACFYNRQLVIKNKPLNTAGVLGGDNKVIFHLLINLRSKMVNWSKMASGQKWSKQFFFV